MDSAKTGDLLYYGEVVQTFLELEGALTQTQHKQFWANLLEPENTTTYLIVLLTKLLALDSGDKASLVELLRQLQQSGDSPITEPRGGAQPDSPTPLRQALLTTVYFVTLYYQCDLETPPFKVILNKWTQILGPTNLKADMVDEIIKMFNPNYLKGNDSILNLVDQCSNIEFPQSLETAIERGDPTLVNPSLLNFYLRSSLLCDQGNTKKGISKLIFETILLFLKHPLISEKRMLSLLHMLKQFLIMSPQTAPEIMLAALTMVKNYYLWPRPYGDVARDLLQLLTIEMKSPGAAMRKRMLEENPELVRGTTKTGKERVVHVLIDQSCPEARVFQELLKVQGAVDISTPQLQLNLLANILSTVLGCEMGELALDQLPREDVVKFYEGAVQILNEAVLMKQEDAESHRIKALTGLKEEIMAYLETNPAKGGFVKPKRAVMPPLNFQFIPVNCSNPSPQKGDPSLQSKYKYPKKPSMEVLASVFGQYAAFADVKNKPIVKIGVVGGDSALHSVTSSFICLKKTAPRSFDGLDVQFFMIPVETSAFASFLARYDGWYGRHVYCLSKCLLRTFPSISLPPNTSPMERGNSVDNGPKAKTWTNSEYDKTIEQLNKMTMGGANMTPKQMSLRIRTDGGQGIFQDLKQLYSEEDKPPTPSSILRSEMENLFREAKWKLDVNAYHCECWAEDNFYCSIPFCQRVELGLKPYARSVQKQISEPTTLTSIQSHRNFKWSPPTFGIKCTQMNVIGVSRPGPTIEPKSYLSIVIANIPMQGDRGVPPNPSKPWLEMNMIEVDKKRKLSKTPDKDLAESPVTSLHVSTVEVESTDKKNGLFYVLLDNVLYGPFTKIRVSSCSDEEAINIPFMTFFPIDLPS